MSFPPVASNPRAEISIAGGKSLEFKFHRIEWASFVNGGYNVQITVDDKWWNTISDIATEEVLKNARRRPTKAKFLLKWDKNRKTEERTGLIVELWTRGAGNSGYVTFTAIDPPSYFLNSGTADGHVFQGKVSDVIREVVSTYAPGISLDVSETQDSNQNYWPMMRQDPKTFIRTLLDWSCSLTPKKTNWIVASRDDRIVIKEQAELEGEEFGCYRMNVDGESDIMEVEMLSNSMIAPLQTQVVTSGISTVTGRLFDTKMDPDQRIVHVNDTNTADKVNVKNLDSRRGFSKPPTELRPGQGSGGTFVRSIPEFTGGELGRQYEDYVDGRARRIFMSMLNTVMRIRVAVHGDPRFNDSTKLGVSTVILSWKDTNGDNYFLSGRWLVYGFHHEVTPSMWKTHLYLSRLDWDATANRKV